MSSFWLLLWDACQVSVVYRVCSYNVKLSLVGMALSVTMSKIDFDVGVGGSEIGLISLDNHQPLWLG